MEDVVLHYRPGSAARLAGLLERAEKVLERFPCRPPPVFRPWFPPAADHRLPIRPSRPPPVISSAVIQETQQDSPVSDGLLDFTSSSVQRPHTARLSLATLEQDKDGLLISDCRPDAHTQAALTEPPGNKLQNPKDGGLIAERRRNLPPATICVRPEPDAPAEKLQNPKDGVSIPASPPRLPPASRPVTPAEISRLSPEKQAQKQKDGVPVGGGEVRRSWSVLAQKGASVRSSPALSKRFHQMVWSHRLHLQQRAKWVIRQQNCGASDIEQVWRLVSRALQSSMLPTCNANIQRPAAEIWVFCDLMFCEPVGRFLKDELRLAGNISLSVHRLGNVFSL
ncbi:shieldin complex subunit 3 [Centroberyx affinis]|uniref:shieldin complex subunit 3 n=1 Tax=Centroberyx affinis TaxID=166261 RepID=UPI003A5C547B